VLLQLPPGLTADVELLSATIRAFPPAARIAVEFRDESWFTSATRDVLQSNGVALCLADSPRRSQPAWRTAPWGFVRFHEGSEPHAPGYERDALRRWVERIGETWTRDDDVYVYFNNDIGGYAIRDAISFAELAAASGLRPTRARSAA
jgi:uncharacterized protein YecE (DUF72 family)